MNFKIPSIVKGSVVPHSVQAKINQEEQQKTIQRKQFYHDLIITVIGVLLGNIDRIINFIVNLLTNLLNAWAGLQSTQPT